MARKLLSLIAALALMLAASTAWAEEENSNPALDKGLRNDETASYALLDRSREAEGKEKIELLAQAVALSPEVPGFHFSLATASFPDIAATIGHGIEGIKAYGRSFWWSMSLAGLLFTSALISLVLSLLIIGLLRLIRDLPLLAHDIAETRPKLLVPAIVILLALLSPVFAVAGALILVGFYAKRGSKAVVYISIIIILLSPVIVKALNTFFSISTPQMRAIVAANEGLDNDYAIQTLGNAEDFEGRLTYALALKREGYIEEAIAEYKGLIDTNPEARVYVNLGNAYQAYGNNDLAKETFKKALGMERSATVLYNLSQVYRDSLDFQTGDKYYDDAVKADSEKVSEHTAIAGRHPNRFVVDMPLSRTELLELALRRSKSVIKVFHLGAPVSAALAFALLIFFAVMDGKVQNRAYRCPDCGKVICGGCTPGKHWGNLCEECDTNYKKDTSPQAKVRRMLASNKQKNRLRGILKGLSFAPPGIAHIYAGWLMSGLVFMWIFLFSLTAIALNPLFTTGMDGYTHGWLNPLLWILAVVAYVSSTLSINRRVEAGWL